MSIANKRGCGRKQVINIKYAKGGVQVPQSRMNTMTGRCGSALNMAQGIELAGRQTWPG